MAKPLLIDILGPGQVEVGLDAPDRDTVLKRLIEILPLRGELHGQAAKREEILQAVLRREEIQTTGIGYGIAIPHGKAHIEDEMVAAAGVCREAVEWGSVDGEPVRIVLLMVSRPDVTGPHVYALAQAARLLGRKDFREALLGAESAEEVAAALKREARES